jgi:putative aminopeptidase FrvX
MGNPGDLYVDIGAASPTDVSKAGVGVLDSVALTKRFMRLGRSGASVPWISSRAGAAILLELASRLAANAPSGRVTLAFVTGQHYRQQGLLSVLRRISPNEVVLLRPGGDRRLEITRAPGASPAAAEKLLSMARENSWNFERGSSVSLDVGPFGPAKIFNDASQAAVITMGAQNAGTPVEVVDLESLDLIGRLLARLVGADWRDSAGSLPASQDRPADPANPARSSLEPLIEELVQTPGVSRSEAGVREKIRARLPSFARRRSFVDERGNLVVPLGVEGKPGAIFVAHMDEIGYEVERIEDTGRLEAKAVGGLIEDLFAWHPVVIHGARGPLDAIMTSSRQIDLGFGSSQEVEALGAKAGGPVTVTKKYRRLLGERISGRSLDDRVGCAVLIASLGRLSEQGMPLLATGAPVWLVFSAEEEVGLLGATFVADRTSPATVYAIDSFVSSDSPVEDRRAAYAPLGAGFVIRALDESGITPREGVKRVADLAVTRGIPMQVGVTAGGNDGSRFVTAGAVNIPLSWPLRYAHTAAEVADLRDIDALMRITTALIEQELAGTAAN